MNDPQNRLDISIIEKRKLRANKIKLKEIHHKSLRSLQTILNVPKIRAMELRALSEFQNIPSIGMRFAQDLISLGFYSLKDIKGKSPAKLVDRLERQSGVWIDPCVEDQFRLVTHYAEHPGSACNWWDFTNERKDFREKHGYPSDRPKKPWYKLEKYERSSHIRAKGETTKRDLYNRLKLAVKFMQKNLQEKITLAQLAGISHLSRFHFHRLFKSAYEVTPLQYLTRLRMKKACRLLTKTKRPIPLIVSSCGFEDLSSFIRLFKKEFKKTPLAYRKLAMNQA